MENISIEKNGTQMPYEIELRTDIGGRKEQQDSAYVYADEAVLFAIVCDGMGGTERGALASRIAVRSGREMITGLIASDASYDPVEFLGNVIRELDMQVSRELGHRKGGTTIVAVLLRDGKLYWTSAGDSRLYILRDDELVQATRDHNYFLQLEEQLQQGEIDDEIYQREADRGEALISYLGIGGVKVYDLTNEALQLQTDDMLLLTTDGLYKAIPHGLIHHILKGKQSLCEKSDMLMKQITVLRDSIILDNTTFALIRIKARGGTYGNCK